MQLSALARDFTLGDGVSKDGVTSEAPQTVLVSLTPPEKEVDDVATTTTGKIKFEITQPLQQETAGAEVLGNGYQAGEEEQKLLSQISSRNGILKWINSEEKMAYSIFTYNW